MFPRRELTIRSGDKVRSLTITSRVQLAAAALVVLAVGGLGASAGALVVGQQRAQEQRLVLQEREALLAGDAARVAAYRAELDSVTGDLERRQAFLERMVEMLPGGDDTASEAQEAPEAQADGQTSAAADLDGVKQALARAASDLPQTGKLAEVEQRQLALVDRLTRFAESRLARAEATIRQLGLDPRAMLMANQQALGGPLEKLATEDDGSLDPRFERLGQSLARLDELERGLARVPQVTPVDLTMVSSGFGFRRDPFTGHAAMHAGLDFRGPTGAPIRAAAEGRVSFVGVRDGYGKVVEISHGNGMMTRYAHMSAWHTRAGQQVEAGELIGAIGSTGRSTGPHLHFEVRVGGRAVNPRPFLEIAPNVLEENHARLHERNGDSHG